MKNHKRYLDEIAAYLRSLPQTERKDILEELHGHLDDQVRALLTYGWRKEEAMRRAIANLGPAKEVGRALRRTHGGGTWGEASLAALPFVAFALAVSIPEWGAPPLRAVWRGPVPLYFFTFGAMYVVFLAGMVAGWLSDMPAWAYPYWGFWFLFTWWWSGLGSPRNIFMGLRAWVPGLVLVGILILITRGVRPLATALRNVLGDWTQVSLALYPAAAFGCWIWFDEMHAVYEGPTMMLCIMLCAVGVIGFIRHSRRGPRLAYLYGAALASHAIAAAVTQFYWQTHFGVGEQVFDIKDLLMLLLYVLGFPTVLLIVIPRIVNLAGKAWRRHLAER